jgi:hypothetical protein
MPTRTQPIHANQYWNDTGVDLIAHTRYRLTVMPHVGEALKDAKYEAKSIAGEDWNSLPYKIGEILHLKRMDEARWFALIGTIDRSHAWIVTDGEIVTAPASGRLICYFNDVEYEGRYKNNSGWVVLDVDAIAD